MEKLASLIAKTLCETFDYVWTEVQPGTVFLHGYVTRPLLKSAADELVKQHNPSAGVENQIEILPISSPDDCIRNAAYQATYANGNLNRYAFRTAPAIHIIVRNGVVSLYGSVATELDHQQAWALARSVPGAVTVSSHLLVEERMAA